MELNIAKTKHLFIRSSADAHHLSVPSIPFSPNVSYLGVILTDRWKWKEHFKRISARASQRLHGIRVLRSSLSRKQLASVYTSQIRSILEYASPVFSSIKSSKLRILEKVQDRCHRLICGRHCSCEMFPSLHIRYDKLALKLFLEITRNSGHPLRSLIPSSLPPGRLSMPLPRNVRRKETFKFKAIRLFNERIKR